MYGGDRGISSRVTTSVGRGPLEAIRWVELGLKEVVGCGVLATIIEAGLRGKIGVGLVSAVIGAGWGAILVGLR